TAASTPSILAGTPLRKRGSNVAGARAWTPLRISRSTSRVRRAESSRAILRAVVVGLEDLHLADPHAPVVELRGQLFGEKARQLLRGGIAAAVGERFDVVDISM